MNLTVFLLSLAAGGIVIGTLCGMLLPRASSGNLPGLIVLGAISTVFGGIFIAAFFEIENVIALPVALALAPVYLCWGALKGGGGHAHAWGGGGGDYSSGDCGGGDSGGGDSGGGCS